MTYAKRRFFLRAISLPPTLPACQALLLASSRSSTNQSINQSVHRPPVNQSIASHPRARITHLDKVFKQPRYGSQVGDPITNTATTIMTNLSVADLTNTWQKLMGDDG
ncbi:hypothetical protein JOL62DRAFT_326819 [Phyllosticta paracitricarpa]|uniref:Uncharacterized protein n=1 Tax=Phyllosticta paracitricarpa TaxID=2016321 RepID=A0ABR1MUX1_9PEZI